MKKLFAFLLSCVAIFAITASNAYAEKVDVTAFIGSWNNYENDCSTIEITRCDNETIDFSFCVSDIYEEFKNVEIRRGDISASAEGKIEIDTKDGTIIHRIYLYFKENGLNCRWSTSLVRGSLSTCLEIFDLGSADIAYQKDDFIYKTYLEQYEIVNVVIDDRPIEFDVLPRLINATTMVPMRTIFEELGYDINWSQETQTITATKDSNTLTMQINNKNMYYNNMLIELNTAPTIKNDRTLVPIRALSECSGYIVAWKQTTNTVYLISPDEEFLANTPEEAIEKAIFYNVDEELEELIDTKNIRINSTSQVKPCKYKYEVYVYVRMNDGEAMDFNRTLYVISFNDKWYVDINEENNIEIIY